LSVQGQTGVAHDVHEKDVNHLQLRGVTVAGSYEGAVPYPIPSAVARRVARLSHPYPGVGKVATGSETGTPGTTLTSR
jgi:hypothetical protein